MNYLFSKTKLFSNVGIFNLYITLLFTFLSSQTKAQLNGSYTICPSGCDYTTISAAASAVQTQGVNGPVVFNIAAGTFNENLFFNRSTTVTDTTTVTFKGQGMNSTIIQANSTYGLYLNQINYYNFEDLTIRNTTTTTGTAYNLFASNADYNTFTKVKFDCKMTGTFNPKYDLYFTASDYNRFKDVIINDSTRSNSTMYGAFFQSSNNNTFDGCLLDLDKNTLAGSFFGFYLTSSNYNNLFNSKFEFRKNDNRNTYHIYNQNCSYTSIKNNRFEGGRWGIQKLGSTNYFYGKDTVINNTFIHQNLYSIYSQYEAYSVYENNIIDSFESNNWAWFSYRDGGNRINGNLFTGRSATGNNFQLQFYTQDPNLYNQNTPFRISNNVFNYLGNNTFNQQIYLYTTVYNSKTFFVNNTISSKNVGTNGIAYIILNSRSGLTVQNNYFENTATGNYLTAHYNGFATNQSFISNNTYVNTTGSNLIRYNNVNYDLAGFQNASRVYNQGTGSNSIKATFTNTLTLEIDSTQPIAKGPFVTGVEFDRLGKKRCDIFTAVGAYESPYGNSLPVAGFTSRTPLIIGIKEHIKNKYSVNDPVKNAWYINGVYVSDSIDLKARFSGIGGFDTIMLVTTTCGGSDTDMQIIRVDSPNVKPTADFISDKNTIARYERVKFFDHSTNNPTSWEWKIYPETVLVGSTPQPAYQFINSNKNYEDIEVQFNYPGEYEVCLITSNVRGSDQLCFKNYVEVIYEHNMCTGSGTTLTQKRGTLYDNGGKTGNVFTIGGTTRSCNITIAPCTDSLYLVVKDFELYSGYQYLRIFEGRSDTGRAFHCTNNASNLSVSGSAGFTGNYANIYPQFFCFPRKDKTNINSAYDTFKVAKSAYIELMSGTSAGRGFAIDWWAIGQQQNPVAEFESVDSNCVGQAIDFTNTSVGENLTYAWDFDGDLSFFESTQANPLWPYFFPGNFEVTLIVSGCGGVDTFKKIIRITNPGNPIVDFEANNTAPLKGEIVSFKEISTECIDDFEWSFSKVHGTGTVSYTNGTNSTSRNPFVIFNDTGLYNVSLLAENITGTYLQNKNSYIRVKPNFCTPTTQNLIQDIGISNVQLNEINNTSAQGTIAYQSFASSASTTIEKGATYTLNISRSTNKNTMSLVAWIDYNDNSLFDTNEVIFRNLNIAGRNVTATFTVPLTATSGSSILRIATNKSGLDILPCGPNEHGEYEDYRVFIKSDESGPAITLVGMDTITIEQGRTFNEPGFSAIDNLDGNVTSSVIETFEPSFSELIPNTYIKKYYATDKSGNTSDTQKRVVIVIPDTTAPTVTINGTLNDSVRVFEIYQDNGLASIIDLVDGDLLGSENTINNVNTTQLGVYTIEYSANDFKGNTAKVVRNVKVYDDIAPNVAFNGNLEDTLELGEQYQDLGVTIVDNYDTALRPQTISNLDSSKAGVYNIKYVSKDNSGNIGTEYERTVVVIDRKAPTINIFGEQVINLDVFDSYEDEGADIFDNDPINQPSVEIGGTYFTEFANGIATKVGTYTVTYSSTDFAGNTNQVVRTINVVDEIAPSVSINGDYTYTIGRWQEFNDPGIDFEDNYYSKNECTVEKTGSFLTSGTDLPGLYSINYVVVDGSGNRSQVINRNIFVVETSSVGTVDANEIKMYPNPTNSNVTIEPGHLGEVARISIIDAAGKEVIIVENGSIRKDAYTVDVSQLNGGIYMVRVQTQNESFISKLNVVK